MKTRLFPCGIAACLMLFLASFAPVKHAPVPSPVVKEKFACAKPTNLRAYPAQNTSHILWNAVPGATSYTFEAWYSYFTQGSYMYLVDSFTTTSTSVIITTDLPGYYDWQVKANCSDNTSSNYAYSYFYLNF